MNSSIDREALKEKLYINFNKTELVMILLSDNSVKLYISYKDNDAFHSSSFSRSTLSTKTCNNKKGKSIRKMFRHLTLRLNIKKHLILSLNMSDAYKPNLLDLNLKSWLTRA